MRAVVWSDEDELADEYRDEHGRQDRGRRLLVTRAALDGIMRAKTMDIIMQVRVQREGPIEGKVHARDRKQYDDLTVTRTYLLWPGGERWQVPASGGPRSRARRRAWG